MKGVRDAALTTGGAGQSSHVRVKAGEEESRAARRLAEYLRMLGVSDRAHIEGIVESVVSQLHQPDSTQRPDAEQEAQRAMEVLQDRVETWQKATFVDLPHAPDPAWLRAFLATHPRALLEEPGRARALANGFGDPSSGSPPVVTTFKRQHLGRPRLPSWLRGLVLPAVTTTLCTTLLGSRALAHVGDPLAGLWLALFACLFGHAAVGFFTAARGFRASRPGELSGASEVTTSLAAGASPLPRTAVVVPIYHEDAADVFAGVAAMRESLQGQPGASSLEFFVLSDSRDPLIAAEEERALRRIGADPGVEVPVYYRRRAQNLGQKAGNLAEFFQRWGDRYEYVVVLDADSLMRGSTLLELVRRMDRSPRVALLQAPIVPIRGQTLLARALQWSTSIAGPLFTRGLMRWSGRHANYYGHNAVLRTRAFLECCALPQLAGRPPLGGPLLSHDFVEAALLCRAGWEVRIAADLDGSYEELPPTLAAYLARDRRWCQGNLQHLRILLSPGLAAMSRLHLLFGAAAYLAGPAWVAFTVLGVTLAARGNLNGSTAAWGLALVLLLLTGPRAFGLARALWDRKTRIAHGGAFGLVATFVLELVLSAILGPVLLVHHTRMVLSVVLGRAVTWGTARRRSQNALWAPWRAELPSTLLGSLLGGGTWLFSPAQFFWLMPIWLPLAAASLTASALGSARLGGWLERMGLLRVPSETHPDPISQRARELRTLTEGDSAGRFRDLVLDPVLVSAHLEHLTKTGPTETGTASSELCERALRVGPAGLDEGERQALLGDPSRLRWLHREAWRVWPTETWQLGRELRQLPPEGS